MTSAQPFAEPPRGRPLVSPRHPLLVQGSRPMSGDDAELLRTSIAAKASSIPPRFFYDDLGSRLFAAITALDAYYPTRAEAELLATRLPAIVAAAPVTGCTFVDLGAGNCEKAARLFAAVRPVCYVAVDIATDFLATSLDCLQRQFPDMQMLGVATDFSRQLELPEAVPATRRLFFYPGSSIGNFTPDEAVGFLGSIRDQMGPDGVLWIGVDLHKSTAVLERAYDDELGVTAAFNRNVLLHVNRIAGTDFRIEDWQHVAFYNERARRIEMHLEAVRDAAVGWPGGRRQFRAGERIHTENSYKHDIAGFTALLARAGLRTAGVWTDPRDWFAFFAAVPGPTS